MKVGLVRTILSPENASLREALFSLGARVEEINAEREFFALGLPHGAHQGMDCVLCRSVSLSRSLALTYALEAAGVPTINSHHSQMVCGDKVLSSSLFSRKGIPTPKVLLAFSSQSALEAVESMGYPCVIKPP